MRREFKNKTCTSGICLNMVTKNAKNYLTGIHVCNVMTIPCLCSVMIVTRDRPDNCRSFSFIVLSRLAVVNTAEAQ